MSGGRGGGEGGRCGEGGESVGRSDGTTSSVARPVGGACCDVAANGSSISNSRPRLNPRCALCVGFHPHHSSDKRGFRTGVHARSHYPSSIIDTTPDVLNSILDTLNTTPDTLNTTPGSLNTSPDTLNTTPGLLNTIRSIPLRIRSIPLRIR
jgi:hypothetical protein